MLEIGENLSNLISFLAILFVILIGWLAYLWALVKKGD